MTKTKIKMLLLYMFYIFALAYYTLPIKDFYINDGLLMRKLVVLSIINLILIVIMSVSNTKDILSPYTIFMIGTFVFHFGQLALNEIGYESDSIYKLKELFPFTAIVKAAIFSLWSINALHIAWWFTVKSINKEQHKDSEFVFEPKNYEKQVITIMFFVMLCAQLYMDYQMAKVTWSMGYGAKVYKIKSQFGYMLTLMGHFYYMLLYGMIILNKNSKNMWKFYYYFGIIYCFLSMYFIGNRGEQVFTLLAILLTRHKFIKPFQKKNLLLLGIYALVLLTFSSVLSSTREMKKEDRNSEYSSSISENPLYDAIYEFGGTIMCVVFPIDYVPHTIEQGNGISYLASAAVMIPDPIGITAKIQPYSDPFVKMGKVSGIPIGGSYIGEAFYNFNWYGIFAMFILGIIIGKVTKFWYSKKLENKFISMITAITLFYGLFYIIRGVFYHFTSYCQLCLYLFVILWVVRNVFEKKRQGVINQ